MRRSLALLVLFLLVLSTPLLAQSHATTGAIEGAVVDAQGGAVPGVTVTVKNTATNYETVTVTDSAGRFRAVLLPLGPYQVTAALQGFATVVQKGLDLGVGQTLTVAIALKQAAASEQIVVTAAAPLIETARTEGATRIDQKAVEGLPNNGRNFLDYTKLTPGVTIVQGPDGDELSINGADFNNPFFGEQRGGQRPPFTFNLDAVKDMVVVADGANAEFGRSMSGFVTVLTQSNPIRIPPRRPDPARQALLLRRARPAEGQLDEADRPEPHRATRRQRVRRPRLAERERPDRPHQRRARPPPQTRLQPEREEPRQPPLQLHLVGAGERHVRRRLVGPQRERDREGFVARPHRRPHVDGHAESPQRIPLPGRAREPPAPVQRPEHHRPEAAASRHRVP